jgi:hypothetical protein
MTTERTRLIVADEHTLGYIMPNSTMVGVLHASILRGATSSESPKPIYMFEKIRLASEKDFNDFRVSFQGYQNEIEYEYKK